jgi:GT2 family glycosyltransferase
MSRKTLGGFAASSTFSHGGPSRPDVSMIVPCYNAAATLADTLTSVQAQTHESWEAICIDDGSTDQTPELLARMARSDLRICHFRVPNGGAPAARNRGLAVARAQHVIFLDSDDILRPQAVEVLLRMRDHVGDRAIIAGGVELLDRAGRSLALFRFPNVSEFTVDGILRDSGLWVTMLVPKAVLGDRPFDETLPPCEDTDLWLRLAHEGVGFAKVPRVVFGYRLHAASVSHNTDRRFASGRRVFERWLPHAREPRPLRDLIHRHACMCGAVALACGAPHTLRRYWSELPPLNPTEVFPVAVAYAIQWAYLFVYGAARQTWSEHADDWLPGIERWLRDGPLAPYAEAVLGKLRQIAPEPQDGTEVVHQLLADRPDVRRIVVYGVGTNGLRLLELLRNDVRLRSCGLWLADDQASELTFELLGLPRDDPRRWTTWPAGTLVLVTPNESGAMRTTLRRAGGRAGVDFVALAEAAVPATAGAV